MDACLRRHVIVKAMVIVVILREYSDLGGALCADARLYLSRDYISEPGHRHDVLLIATYLHCRISAFLDDCHNQMEAPLLQTVKPLTSLGHRAERFVAVPVPSPTPLRKVQRTALTSYTE